MIPSKIASTASPGMRNSAFIGLFIRRDNGSHAPVRLRISEMTINGKREGISVSKHIFSPRFIYSAEVSDLLRNMVKRIMHRTKVVIPDI